MQTAAKFLASTASSLLAASSEKTGDELGAAKSLARNRMASTSELVLRQRDGSTRRALSARYRLTREKRSEEHRLNSSHSQISYAVFCLKKKKRTKSRP